MSDAGGESAAAIARQLTTDGVPALGGGTTWHPSTVTRILKRANKEG